MDILKLNCTNCGSTLKWNERDLTFTCENCGTKYKTDNKYTFHIVDEAKVKEQEVALEKAKNEVELAKINEREEKRDSIILIIILAVAFILIFTVLIFAFFIKALKRRPVRMDLNKKYSDDIGEAIQREIEAEVQLPDIGELIEEEIKADMRHERREENK